MTPDRWKQISQLYEAALARTPSDRVAYVEEACAGDLSLQRDVQALLDQPTSPKGLEGLTPSAIAHAIGNADNGGLTGHRFGVYLVGERIGVGGMGEVYRARDTSLPRDVAIKVLPQAFAADADRLARFEREARVLASLDHPHIGTILGVEESDGVRALVLGFVEGDTLAERIARGPIPLAEALEYARQIADALEAAHEKGIIHRDLKPSNIKITPAGVVKVLDFGLAKAEQLLSSDVRHAVTVTASGIVMGTVAYMSPEQARGHAVDKRADIWAFGCVLYEMLTGRDAFARLTPSDTVAAILDRDPDLRALPTNTPPSIERLLKRCLEKNPKRRLRDIGEARVAIDDAQHGRALPDDSPRPVVRWWLVATCLGVVLIGVAAAALLVWTRVRPPAAGAEGAARFLVGVTPADAFGPGPTRTNPFPYPTRTDVALSPDGTLLVFSARKDGRQQLYLHTRNRLESTPIAGTDNSNSPFFSPDGQWLGFWTGTVDVGAIGELKKMRLDGSPPVTLANVPPLRGATWGSDEIVFAVTDGEGLLWRVPESGGLPQTLSRRAPNDFRRHSLPQLLPDGRAVLYTVGSERLNFADGEIAVMSLATGETHVVLDRGVDARYVPTGHLVYVRDGALMAVSFDPNGLRVTGTPVAIVNGVMQAVRAGSLSLNETGAAQFSVSNTGTLAYVPSAPVPERLMSLVWVGRNGTVTPSTLPPGPYGGPRLSPDGQRVALFTLARGTFIHDLVRGGLMSVAPSTTWPTFTPDGKQITLSEPSGFVSMSLAGGATDRFAIDAPVPPHPGGAWSPDGQTLLFTKFVTGGVWEIRALSRTGGDRKVHPSGNAAVNERYPQFSPDGEWFVYSSNEQGAEEVFVERYRGAAERHPISTNGGTAPAWAASGREVFFVTAAPEGRIRMMAVDVTLSPRFVAGRPHMLFEGRYGVGSPHRDYDVSRDGRFLMVRGPEGPPSPPVTQMVQVLNWFEELKRLATSAR